MSNRGMPALPNQASVLPDAKVPEVHDAVKAHLADKLDLGFGQKGPISVVALRNGFYKTTRISEGDKFTVMRFSELGSWMKCLDAGMAKKHHDAIEARKAGRKKQGGK